MSTTINRTDPIAIRLLALMSTDQGWSARWLGDPDWLNHASGLHLHLVSEWTQFHELDPESPHLVIYLPGGDFVHLALQHTPRSSRSEKPQSIMMESDPYLIAFRRLSAVTQAAALDAWLPVPQT